MIACFVLANKSLSGSPPFLLLVNLVLLVAVCGQIATFVWCSPPFSLYMFLTECMSCEHQAARIRRFWSRDSRWPLLHQALGQGLPGARGPWTEDSGRSTDWIGSGSKSGAGPKIRDVWDCSTVLLVVLLTVTCVCLVCLSSVPLPLVYLGCL